MEEINSIAAVLNEYWANPECWMAESILEKVVRRHVSAYYSAVFAVAANLAHGLGAEAPPLDPAKVIVAVERGGEPPRHAPHMDAPHVRRDVVRVIRRDTGQMAEGYVAESWEGTVLRISASDDLCPYCHETLHIVWVHGHGQCSKCGTNIAPCCDGEQGDDHGM